VFHGKGHRLVFGVYQANDIEDAKGVDAGRTWVYGFGRKPCEFINE